LSFSTSASPSAAADQALDGEDGVFGVGDGLPFGGLTHEAFVVGEGDDGGRRPRPFGVFDDPRLAAIHDGDAGVCRAEVDTNHFGHDATVPFFKRTGVGGIPAASAGQQPKSSKLRGGFGEVPRDPV
jgi:hypothetical protein